MSGFLLVVGSNEWAWALSGSAEVRRYDPDDTLDRATVIAGLLEVADPASSGLLFTERSEAMERLAESLADVFGQVVMLTDDPPPPGVSALEPHASAERVAAVFGWRYTDPRAAADKPAEPAQTELPADPPELPAWMEDHHDDPAPAPEEQSEEIEPAVAWELPKDELPPPEPEQMSPPESAPSPPPPEPAPAPEPPPHPTPDSDSAPEPAPAPEPVPAPPPLPPPASVPEPELPPIPDSVPAPESEPASSEPEPVSSPVDVPLVTEGAAGAASHAPSSPNPSPAAPSVMPYPGVPLHQEQDQAPPPTPPPASGPTPQQTAQPTDPPAAQPRPHLAPPGPPPPVAEPELDPAPPASPPPDPPAVPPPPPAELVPPPPPETIPVSASPSPPPPPFSAPPPATPSAAHDLHTVVAPPADVVRANGPAVHPVEDLRSSMEEMATRIRGRQSSAAPDPWDHDAATGQRGQIVVMASGKGGVGKSTLSMWVTEALHAMGSSTVLVDANIGQGDLAKMSQSWHYSPGLGMLIGREPLLYEDVEEALISVDRLGDLLAAPQDSAGVDFAESMRSLAVSIDLLASRREYVIVDSPVASPLERIHTDLLVGIADTIIVVVDAYEPTLQDCLMWMQSITQHEDRGGFGVPLSSLIVTLNRYEEAGRGSMTAEEVRNVFPYSRFAGPIPRVPAPDNVNQGRWGCPPEAAGQVASLVAQFAGIPETASADSAPARRGLLARLRGR